MTGSDAAVSLTGVGKRYQQTEQRDEVLLRRLARVGRSKRKTELWALRDIDLTVAQGETIGVIGRNGSGKTTLLRMLSGVSAPSVGRVRVVGRVAPLIGIGVGFNNELTGRENVFTNGRLLGMSEAKIKRDYDAIVDFSEIEGFLDTPVNDVNAGASLGNVTIATGGVARIALPKHPPRWRQMTAIGHRENFPTSRRINRVWHWKLRACDRTSGRT